MHALHHANELFARVRFSFQILLFVQHAETVRKNVWEKSNDAYLLSIRVQTTLNHIRLVFYHNFNVKESVFSEREVEHELKMAFHDTLTWAALSVLLSTMAKLSVPCTIRIKSRRFV